MEYIKSFFSYLFNAAPGSAFSYYIPLFILSGVLIIGSIVFSLYYKNKKKTDFAFKRVFKKLGSRMLLFGILFLLSMGFRYENIPYFSMRVLIYVLFIVFLYFVYRYLKLIFVVYPKEKQNAELNKHTTKKEDNKYLPNKNKKK